MLARLPGFPYLFLVVMGLVVAASPSCHRSAPGAGAGARPDATAVGIPSAAAVAEPVAARGTHVALLYGSNLFAEYEHCGCPTHPLGGLGRRATAIDRARMEADGVLVVDAGDMLTPPVSRQRSPAGPRSPEQIPADEGEVARRARLILAAYARMGITAVLPGERDLVVGVPRLRRWLTSFHIAAVASNLLTSEGAPLFERDRIVTVAGIAVGILGVVGPQPEDAALWSSWPVVVRDPATVAREEIASLRARGARMIVALVHLGSSEAVRQLLEAAPGIDWAVQGHTQMQLETADSVGGARRLEAFSLGKLVGRVDIHVVGTSFAFTDRGDRAQVLTILGDHRRQLADLETRAGADETDALRAYHEMRRKGIEAALIREAALLRALPAAIEGSWFENRLIPLDGSLPEQSGVGILVAAYDRENTRRAAAGLPVWLGPGAADPVEVGAAAASSSYAGTAACVACHAAAWRFFRGTKHAQALSSLARVKRDRDPTCVACHATGYFLPGGTTRISEATTLFKDVGCESCHGPGRGHLAASDKIGTTRRSVEVITCLGCHTPDQTDGEFEPRRFMAAILGPGHGLPAPP